MEFEDFESFGKMRFVIRLKKIKLISILNSCHQSFRKPNMLAPKFQCTYLLDKLSFQPKGIELFFNDNKILKEFL